MKIANNPIQGLAMALIVAGTAWQARASYDYTISDGGLVSGFGLTLDGQKETGIQVGGMRATASGASVPGYSSFTTVSLDISGRLYVGTTYTFTEVGFSGQTGIDPSWGNSLSKTVSPAAASDAINNAAALFAAHENVTSATDWAALQLAVWKALYDTGSNGKIIWGANSRFVVTTDPTANSAAWTEAQTWLNNLNTSSSYAGFILQPNIVTGQELIVGVTPVPEPTTLAAGALLLLPFGASTLRFLRKPRRGV